ncbi:MAG: hypothetical protein HFJ66_06090 [Eggerthellaceae bacterium]|nr:hypothetical protein [Eggerthellaceae bacterium]
MSRELSVDELMKMLRGLDGAVEPLEGLGLTKADFKRKYAYLQEDMPNADALVSRAI